MIQPVIWLINAVSVSVDDGYKDVHIHFARAKHNILKYVVS